MNGPVFAVDVGGTKIHSAIVDPDGSVLAEVRSPTPAANGVAALELIARHLADLRGGHAITAAGVGLPGAVHPRTGHVTRMVNLPGFEDRDVRALFADRLDLPIALENDVNMAALGEARWGHGRDGTDSLAFIALGTGIGMGLINDGRLLRGARGMAGEIGFLPLGADPRDPAVHEMGPLESVVGGAALATAYRRRGGTGVGSLRDLDRAGHNDAYLEAVLDSLATRVAEAILSIESVVDPALYVLGGGIGGRPDLPGRVTAALALFVGTSRDVRPSLLGHRAGVLGAASAALAL